MSHFVAYILQFQEIIVYKIPPGGGGGSIASLRSKNFKWDDLIPHLRKCTKDTTLIWFEIRIMHRILATYSLLQKMGILLDNRCCFGCGEEETIIHLFCDCRFVEPFWRRIHSLINVKCNLNIPEWNNVDILEIKLCIR